MKQLPNEQDKTSPKRKNYTERVTILLTKEQKRLLDENFPSYKRGDRIRQAVLDTIFSERPSMEAMGAPTPVAVDMTQFEDRFTKLEQEVVGIRTNQNKILAALFELRELLEQGE